MSQPATSILLESSRFASSEEHDQAHEELSDVDRRLVARVGAPAVQLNGTGQASEASGLYAELHELRQRIGALEVKIARAGILGIAVGTAVASIVERWVGGLLGG